MVRDGLGGVVQLRVRSEERRRHLAETGFAVAERNASLGSAAVAFAISVFVFALLPGAAVAAEGQAAYVDTTALNLRADAGTKSAIVGILLRYDAVTVLGTKRVGNSTWYDIEAGGGYTNGYVSARYVQFGEVPEGAVEEEILDYGPEETPTLVRGQFKYVGPGACAECHNESTGNFDKGASTVWAHTVHSAAYQTLSKDYTKVISRRKRNIEDPANDWRCLKCHVTAYGADASQLAPSYSHEDGVGCEVCHGPGSGYADEDHGPGNPNRASLGFQVLTNLTERREVCTSCHNPRSPTYIPFNLREFSRTIAHWVDPGDEFYYEDAVAEAKRRQNRVDQAKSDAAATLAAAEDNGRAEREAAEARKREGERKAREAAIARADAAEKARLEAEAEAADRAAAEEARKRKERDVAERKAARARLEAEEKRKKDAERRAAEAALAAEADAAAEREAAANAARKAAEKQALAAAKNATGVDAYLEDVDEVITLNTNGKKYEKVEFPHLAHASKQYLPNGQCVDCHHTQEGDEAPEACSDCHDIGGDAEEDSAKKRAYHTKNAGFPREPDQEHTSCVGCHKSMNALLDAGERQGEKAPTKCTNCHARNK